MEKTLVRLIYASHAADAMKPADLRNILHAAQRNNAHHGITGMLCHGNRRFLQYLEGRRTEVNAIYAHILADKRHRDLVLLDYNGITEPRFETWSMGFVNGNDPRVMGILHRNTDQLEFRPEDMAGVDALLVTEQLKSFIDPQFTVEPDAMDDQQQTILN